MANFLDLTTGLPALWAKIKSKFYTKAEVDALVAKAEDDVEVLNLLTEFGYVAPIADADGYVITDSDNNIILG